jgi:hypothetical protein
MGAPVEVEQLRGADEEWLAQLDPATPLARVAVGLLERRVARVDGEPADGERLRALPVGELDLLLLELWRRSLGSRGELVARCPAEGCRTGIDVDFDLGDLPVEPLADAPHDGAADVEFRLPTVGDLDALAPGADAAALLDRCVVGKPPADAAAREALEREIARRCARVADELTGRCPECGTEFAIAFRPLERLPAEVARRRPQFERDVHLLSTHYGWTLTEILGLTLPRRRHYVERLVAQLETAAHAAPAGASA